MVLLTARHGSHKRIQCNQENDYVFRLLQAQFNAYSITCQVFHKRNSGMSHIQATSAGAEPLNLPSLSAQKGCTLVSLAMF